MVTFLRRIPSTERVAISISLGIGLLLMGIKFTAYFITNSAAIFSDALESIVNVLASAMAFWALSVAHRPADQEHPYGHGKVEFMSAAFEGGMILLAAIVMTFNAIDTLLFTRPPITQLGIGMSLMALAMAVNGGVGYYLVRLGRRLGSLALEADGHHLLSDAITSIVALAALATVRLTGAVWMDPVAAILIAIYIAWMGARLIRRSSAGLMDKQDLEDERMLRRIIESHIGPTGRQPRICSYHKLRHRHSGRYHWVDFHLMVPPNLSVGDGHGIASAIEYELEVALGEANATAHVEPCPSQGCPLHPDSSR
jgi:cation diffusion facilitator family transporter